MVKRIKAQHQRHGRQWLLGTVSALSLLATAHAKADQVTVKDGDTVWDLANQYQTSVNAIEDANPHVKKINSSVDLIYAGQQLELSKNSTVSQTSAVDSDSYTVKSGDTLSQISERLHVSLADLVSWNHLSNPDQLVIGQQLIVKGTAAASQTPASTSAAEASNTAVSVPATANAGSVSQTVVQTAPVVSAESTASDGTDSNSNAASQASQADEPAAALSQAATPAVTSAQDLTSGTEQSSTAASSEMVSAESSAANMASADTVSSFDDQSAATTAASSTSETVPVEQTAASSTTTTAAAISSADAINESASAEQPTQSTVASSVAESTNQQAASSTSLAAADSSAASTQTATTDYSTAAASSSTSEQASTNSTAGTADSAVSTNSSSDLTTGSVVSLAVKLANANIPYVWGGASLSGMDCSGLVDYVFQNAEGIPLPHYTVSLESCVSQHSVAEAQPGDILFWGNHGSTYHCAIYIGNNQYVAAPQPGQNVEIETISPYFMPSFAGTVIH
ncbi:LysM peptidoglycan-binding domain-containing protein [Limosilactobacillus mucosae]|uniref:C40 family peptidase n=1 Tax=Limosilactobacillus mucosae TaxID=97478 RepID=UPI0023AEE5C3|nr:C40 family peptidase [Limosilactobacillus mucosae]MDE8677245.1 LysM peptidoglycan-binding domain-containing protein [Limosilactobacillus mucosae]